MVMILYQINKILIVQLFVKTLPGKTNCPVKKYGGSIEGVVGSRKQ
jgi:hypothetical protein